MPHRCSSCSAPPAQWRALLVAALLALPLSLAGAAHAQSDAPSDTASAERPPALQSGGWALQFRTTGLDDALSGLQGTFVSARYHLSRTSALRLGVSIDASSQDVEQRRTPPAGPTETDREEDQSDQDYGLSGEYVHYYSPAENFFLFTGVGPHLGYTHLDVTTTSFFEGTAVTENRQERTTYRIGIGGGAGIEWYVHPNISLSAEYRFQFARESTEETQVSENLDTGQTNRAEQDITTYRFGGRSVQVGVTFSFGP